MQPVRDAFISQPNSMFALEMVGDVVTPPYAHVSLAFFVTFARRDTGGWCGRWEGDEDKMRMVGSAVPHKWSDRWRNGVGGWRGQRLTVPAVFILSMLMRAGMVPSVPFPHAFLSTDNSSFTPGQPLITICFAFALESVLYAATKVAGMHR